MTGQTIDDRAEAVRALRELGLRGPDGYACTAQEVAPSPTDPPQDPLSRLMAELDRQAVNGNEVGDMAPAKIIVPELGITEKSTVEIFGKMKSGKTFFTLDLACSMAAGASWRGHDLKPRKVLYLIGEGTPGLGSRIRAWKYHRGIDNLEHLTFQPTKLSLTREDDFRALLAWVQVRGPFGMIFVDTLARYSVGANENTSEMRTVVDRAEWIRDYSSSDAPLIVVHHSGRGNNDHGRGDSGVEAACDLIVRTTKDGNKMAAEIMDARHAPDGLVLRSTLDAVPEAREPGEDHDPAVIVPDLAPTSSFLPESRRHVIDALESVQVKDQWVASGTWEAASEMTASTFHRAKKDVTALGYVEVNTDGKYPRYRLAPVTPSEQEF